MYYFGRTRKYIYIYNISHLDDVMRGATSLCFSFFPSDSCPRSNTRISSQRPCDCLRQIIIWPLHVIPKPNDNKHIFVRRNGVQRKVQKKVRFVSPRWKSGVLRGGSPWFVKCIWNRIRVRLYYNIDPVCDKIITVEYILYIINMNML